MAAITRTTIADMFIGELANSTPSRGGRGEAESGEVGLVFSAFSASPRTPRDENFAIPAEVGEDRWPTFPIRCRFLRCSKLRCGRCCAERSRSGPPRQRLTMPHNSSSRRFRATISPSWSARASRARSSPNRPLQLQQALRSKSSRIGWNIFLFRLTMTFAPSSVARSVRTKEADARRGPTRRGHEMPQIRGSDHGA